MIGGSSIYPDTYPTQPTNPAPQQQRSTGQYGLVRTQTSPSPVQFRAQAAEETAPTRALPPLQVPSADQFGLGAKNRVVEVDWTSVRRRLAALSVTSFHLQKLATGFRFAIVVPTADGSHRKFECDAATDAEAIEQVLNRAEHGDRQ
jgi:hypothetical protein